MQYTVITIFVACLPLFTVNAGKAINLTEIHKPRDSKVKLYINNVVPVSQSLLNDLRVNLLGAWTKHKKNYFPKKKKRRTRRTNLPENSPAVIYIPVGGGSPTRCPDEVDEAAVSISQLVFLSLSLGLFTSVANIANNINNNNNNNNNNNDNNINTNNLNLAANANSGNQITVQLPPVSDPSTAPQTSVSRPVPFTDKLSQGSTIPSFFGITFGTNPPPVCNVADGNLTCYSCRLDFRKGYDATNPCLGRYGSKLDDDYIVNCGSKDIYCRVERTEVNGMLILLTRECVDQCYYGCRPKGFGINFEACAECCNTCACNDFYPESGASEIKGIRVLNAGIIAISAFKGWRRL